MQHVNLYYLSQHIHNFANWIISEIVKPKAMKLLEEVIGENLCDFRLDKDFLIWYKKSDS